MSDRGACGLDFPHAPHSWFDGDHDFSNHLCPGVKAMKEDHISRFQLLCNAIYDWLLEQGYNDEDADQILRQLIDEADARGLGRE